MTLEPDGEAAACKAVSNGFDSHRRLSSVDCLLGFHQSAKLTKYLSDPLVDRFHTGPTACRDSIVTMTVLR